MEVKGGLWKGEGVKEGPANLASDQVHEALLSFLGSKART